nr:uncharacterized protein LOC124818240 [Hydra vulgaris]
MDARAAKQIAFRIMSSKVLSLERTIQLAKASSVPPFTITPGQSNVQSLSIAPILTTLALVNVQLITGLSNNELKKLVRTFLLRSFSHDEKEKENRVAELISIPLLYQQNAKKSSWSSLRTIMKGKIFLKNFENVKKRSSANDISEETLFNGSVVTNYKPTMRNSSRRYTAESFEDIIFISILQNDYNALLRALKTNNVNINYMRPPGLTPLHQACVVGNLQMVETLIFHGADAKLRTWSNLTPLLIANMFGHFDVALFLINQGANTKDIQDGVAFDSKLASSVLISSKENDEEDTQVVG